jgi:hypothetical protein
MRTVAAICTILIWVLGAAACSTPVPTELRLSSSGKRSVNDQPGTEINAQRFACADRMLNLSPASEAREIDARVLSKSETVVIEVDALLLNFGTYGRSLPVTYHCEYVGGALTLAKWTRGLTDSK